LNGLWAQSSTDRRAKLPALSAVMVLCLLLMALLMVVQVAHMHPFDSDADHCPLCIAMHSAVPVAVFAAAVMLIQIRTAAPVFEPCVVIRHRHPKLFTRPPPTGC